MRRLALPLALTLGGCALPGDGPEVYDPGLIGALLVMDALGPGSRRVVDFAALPMITAGDAFLTAPGPLMQVVPGPAGARLVHLLFATSTSATVPNHSVVGYFGVRADGEEVRLARPTEAGPLVYDPRRPTHALRIAPLPSSGSPGVVECGPERAIALRWAPAEDRLSVSTVPTATCQALAGTAVGPDPTTPDRVIIARATAEAITASQLDPARGVEAPLFTAARPPEAGLVRWVGQARGELLALFTGTGAAASDAVLIGAGGQVARVALPPVIRAQRASSGFWLDTVDGALHHWGDDGALHLVAAPEAEAWHLAGDGPYALRVRLGQNPYTPLVNEPTAFELRANHGPAVLVATTPCQTRHRCRLHGESYPIAALEAAPGGDPRALFAFWSWTGALGVFTAPLSRPAIHEGD